MNKFNQFIASCIAKAKGKKAIATSASASAVNMRSPRIPKAERLARYKENKDAGTLKTYKRERGHRA